jgi:hypothetical protein
MTKLVKVELKCHFWGYLGLSAQQRVHEPDDSVIFIGGDYQICIPHLSIEDARKVSFFPLQRHLEEMSHFPPGEKPDLISSV